MKDVEFKVLSNEMIAQDIFRMTLDGDTSDITKPGQFIEIKIPGRYLRRPISVCDWSEGKLTLIYKVVGEGTEDLSFMEPGEYLTALTGLGNGYDLRNIPKNPVIAGGGVGVPPMYALAKALKQQGITPYVALGFNSKDDVFYEQEFRGCRSMSPPSMAVTARRASSPTSSVITTTTPSPAARSRC